MPHHRLAAWIRVVGILVIAFSAVLCATQVYALSQTSRENLLDYGARAIAYLVLGGGVGAVLVALASVVGLALAYPAGMLVDRYGRKTVIVPATVMAGVSLVLFVFAPSGIGVREASMYGLLLAVATPGQALGAVALNRVALTLVELLVLVVGGLFLRGVREPEPATEGPRL